MKTEKKRKLVPSFPNRILFKTCLLYTSGRITVNGSIAQFSAKLSVPVSYTHLQLFYLFVMRYLTVDGYFDGTGIRDAANGGYLEHDEVGIRCV